MNYYEQHREKKIAQIEAALIRNEPVNRFEVYPLRKELRKRLKGNEAALHELEILIESVLETI